MGRFQKLCLTVLLGFISSGWFAVTATAETVHIAVASNFAAPTKSLLEAFEAETGHKSIVSLGSSGKFYAQILHGAPFDVFFSADQAKPAALVAQGLVIPGSRRTYAIGRLALWSNRENYINGTPSVLEEGEFSKLALANPRLAPYGAAAVEVLEALQLRRSTEHKWVQGENIAQTYQFVSTANADLGFIALSQVLSQVRPQGKSKVPPQEGAPDQSTHIFGRGSGWVVPANLHLPIRQDVVLLKRAGDNPAATALMTFIHSLAARKIIESYGYSTSS
tara:strand:+ start:34078 stop:34911 length:834 start_codon:yes stop_codon:yes gene_type:complete